MKDRRLKLQLKKIYILGILGEKNRIWVFRILIQYTKAYIGILILLRVFTSYVCALGNRLKTIFNAAEVG